MTDRNRRMLIGFGLMFGLQFILAWVARIWLGIVGSSPTIVGILLIFAIAIYFGGGLVMGLLAEKLIWLELLATASGAIILNILLWKIGVAPVDLTFLSVVSVSKSPVLFLLINFSMFILMAFVGGFIGVRMQRQPEETSISPERRKDIS